MKHNLLLFLLMFFFPFYSWGQASSEPVGILLTDESELVDGGLYVMAGRVGISSMALIINEWVHFSFIPLS